LGIIKKSGDGKVMQGQCQRVAHHFWVCSTDCTKRTNWQFSSVQFSSIPFALYAALMLLLLQRGVAKFPVCFPL